MALAPDGLHRSVRIGREEAIDLMRSRDRLRRRAERRSDAGKREHRPTLPETKKKEVVWFGSGVGVTVLPTFASSSLRPRHDEEKLRVSHWACAPPIGRRLPTSRKYAAPPP